MRTSFGADCLQGIQRGLTSPIAHQSYFTLNVRNSLALILISYVYNFTYCPIEETTILSLLFRDQTLIFARSCQSIVLLAKTKKKLNEPTLV